MSISALISRFGTTLYVRRSTTTIGNDGEMSLDYKQVDSARGFVQPSVQTSDVAQGRENARTTTSIFFEGLLDVEIDDEIHDVASGTGRTWRIVGSINPGFVGTTGSAPHLSMTVVECVEVEPTRSLA